jgi:two-component system, OmpR family, copper resistance phosphate regulon response regulator CusR
VKILIVEDDRKVAGFLEQGFREEQFEVEVARDGDEALGHALAGQFDIILLDYMLPKRSGPEVAAEIRRAGRAVPILMLTARDDAHDIRTALGAGVNAYVTKPFRFDDLLQRVEAMLPRSSHPA